MDNSIAMVSDIIKKENDVVFEEILNFFKLKKEEVKLVHTKDGYTKVYLNGTSK